ncbi:hypothetical protein M1116_02030 [Patescibacteria group bacterium]|nr:hypothetical protein [Patescibacteria group bacterium]
MALKELVGSGEKIMLVTLPLLVIGLILNYLYPSVFAVGGSPAVVNTVAVLFLIPGLIIWFWSVALVLIHVPHQRLITTGPYVLVRHPLYTGFGLLVLPAVGLLLNSWLGLLLGLIVYGASRLFSPEEEKHLSRLFGTRWDDYRRGVKIPWL